MVNKQKKTLYQGLYWLIGESIDIDGIINLLV